MKFHNKKLKIWSRKYYQLLSLLVILITKIKNINMWKIQATPRTVTFSHLGSSITSWYLNGGQLTWGILGWTFLKNEFPFTNTQNQGDWLQTAISSCRKPHSSFPHWSISGHENQWHAPFICYEFVCFIAGIPSGS